MIAASFKMFKQMIKQITSEAMMILLVIAPVLAGLFFRFGIPLLERYVLVPAKVGEILVPYYGLFNWLLALLTGMLFAFVGGLVVLGEIDDRISVYICLTPAGCMGYVLSRIIIPALVSGIVTVIVVPIFSLVHVDALNLIIMSVSTTLSGIITSMLVVSISSNKVEGMAVGKLAGGFGMVLFIPFILKGAIQYVFSIFPMFWVGRYLIDRKISETVISLMLFAVWIFVLYRKYRRKIEG